MDIVLLHHLEQNQRAADIVLVIVEGERDRFTHSLEAREMNHRIEFDAGEQRVDGSFVAQVNVVETVLAMQEQEGARMLSK